MRVLFLSSVLLAAATVWAGEESRLRELPDAAPIQVGSSGQAQVRKVYIVQLRTPPAAVQHSKLMQSAGKPVFGEYRVRLDKGSAEDRKSVV